jgi:hypothetical protein
VFVLNRLKNTTGDTLAHSNDKLHGAYKVLEDAFYAWLSSLEALGGGGIVQVPFDSDVEISRLRDRQLQDELIGIQVQLTIYTTWYCGTDNPNLPSSGTCADATILNADGSSYLTVASGGSVQLTGVEVTGNTSATGVYNDGSTFQVSGVEVTGNTPISGTFNDGSTVSVSGFELTGRTAASGTFNDGSSYEVSGVEVTGATSASGTYNDGSVFTVSGVTVNDDGNTFTLQDGDTYNVFRNGWSVQLNGTNQYLDQDTTDFNFGYSDAFSVEFWVYNNDLRFATYICNLSAFPLDGWRIGKHGTGTNRGGIFFAISDNGNRDYVVETNSTSLLTVGLWHHVVVTKPANNVAANARIYINTVSVPFTVAATGGTGTPTFSDKLTIGANSDLSSIQLNALFDSCIIYNRELSAAEVTSHYNNGRPTDRSGDAGALRYFRFENDLTDELGNQDLTGYNSPTFSRQRP